jgi:tetratricopeptide (TPR) repeat protein
MLGNLFRKKSLEELETEASDLFRQGRLGEAKLAYDRLEDRAKKAAPACADRAREQASACCDGIAQRRVDDAQNLARTGHVDLAREELAHALETARSEAMLGRVRDAMRALERRDAISHAVKAPELSADERFTLIQGAWEPLQAAELESYGEPLVKAVVALEDGDAKRALPLLEQLVATAKAPSYLWLEVGRARLLLDELEGAEAALRKFLSRIGPDEGGAARLSAHREIARLLHTRGDHEQALAELEAACDALEEDPRPLLDLGNYLRMLERPHEAVEVLELCASLFNEQRIEWPVLNELGVAYAEAGKDEQAVSTLETMLEHLNQRGQTDFPALGTATLARVQERRGNLARAADLFRALAEGSDVANHGLYHREAARLLDLLGLGEEARRMAERAEALKVTEPVE